MYRMKLKMFKTIAILMEDAVDLRCNKIVKEKYSTKQ